MGGEIAWRYALAHPARVERLVLVDAAGYPYGDRRRSSACSARRGWRRC
jgi:pimeloyl-ACP methyl ester carboxylesterase